MKSGKISFRAIEIAVFLTGCGLISAALLTIPIDRNIGLIFRQKLYILPILFCLACAAGRARPVWLKLVLNWALFGAFLLPLAGLWNSGASDQYIFSGSIPFSDAFIHQQSTLRFLYGSPMNQSSAVRPLSLVFYAWILKISGNNFYVLYAFVAVLIALTAIWVSRRAARSFGSIESAVLYVTAYFYIRRYLGTFMTEAFAFEIGLLALIFLWIGLEEKRTAPIIAGFFAASLALTLRPGAVFALPAFGLWFYFIWCPALNIGSGWIDPRRIGYGMIALFAMIFPILLNGWVGRQVFFPDRILTNNQAYEIFYGLCLGGKDAYETMFRTELTSAFGTSGAAQRLIDLCKSEIYVHPENIWITIRWQWSIFLFDVERGFYSFFEGSRLGIVDALRYAWMALWCVGAGVIVKRRRCLDGSLGIALILGMFFSRFLFSPMVYRMRYDAATIPFDGAVLAVGVYFLRRKFQRLVGHSRPIHPLDSDSEKKPSGARSEFYGGAVLVVWITGIMIFSTLWIKTHPIPIPAETNRRCADGSEPWLTRIEPGNFIVLRNYDLRAPHAPSYYLNYVRPRLHDTSASELFPYTDRWEGEMTVISGLDLRTMKDLTVFADWSMDAGASGFVEVCGRKIEPTLYRSYTYVEAAEIFPLNPPDPEILTIF